MIRNIHMYFYDLFRMYMNFLGISSEEAEETPEAKLMRQYAMDSLARADISAIRPEDIRSLLAAVCEVSERDALKLQKLLSCVFDYGVAIALLDESPCNEESVPQHKRTLRNDSIYIFTEEEISRLLETFSHHYLQNAFLLVLVCGLSSREIMQVRISDYDPSEHSLSLPDSHGAKRSIHLIPFQEKIIQQEIIRQRKMERLRGPNGEPASYLFGNYQGKKHSATSIKCAVDMVRRNSRVPEFSLSHLRQYFIIQSIRGGDNPGDVIQYVGLNPNTAVKYLYAAAKDNSNTANISMMTALPPA